MPEKINLELVLKAYDRGLKKGLDEARKGLDGLRREGGLADRSLTDLGRGAARSRRELDTLSTSTGSLTGNLKKLVAGYLGFKAVTGIYTKVISGAKEAETAQFKMVSSIEAANREFSRTGDVEHWEKAVKRLSGEITVYSETALKGAVSRTIDMTKRLGLSAAQMETVIARTADLAAGKTDLEGGIERVTAALRGEAEASEYLGLTLNENYVKSWYLAHDAHAKAWKDLTDLEKAQVRYKVFLEQTAATQGRAAASATTYAGAMQQMTAAVENAISNNQDINQALVEMSRAISANSAEIGKFVSSIVTLVGETISWAAENRELLATLGQGAGLLLALSLLRSGAVRTVEELAGLARMTGNLAGRMIELETGTAAAGAATSRLNRLLGQAGLAGAAGLAAYALGSAIKETLRWSAEMERGNEVLEAQLPLIDRHGEKLRLIAERLGIALADQEEYNGLLRAGAIYRDRENNQLRLNYELYLRYHAGLIEAAEGHRELAAGSEKSAAGMVAEAEAAARAQAELDRFIASLPASSKALDSYAVKVADLKLALAENEISQAEFNARMLKLNQEHWAAEVKLLENALAEEKKKFNEGQSTAKNYEDAVLKLKDAKLKLIEATNKLNEAEGKGLSSLEKLEKRVDDYAEKMHLSAEKTKDLKIRLGLLKRPVEETGEGLKAVGDGAGSATEQLGNLAKQLSLTAIAAADTADWGYQKWQEFANRLHLSVADLKKAVGEIRAEMDAANSALERWREQTKRKEFSASTRAVVEKYQEADEEIIRSEIKRQQDVIYSFSEWISPQQKVKAREIINALEKLLRDRQKFATGGMVPGIGDGDTVPALLTPGEYVIRKPAVQALGVKLLDALNFGRLPRPRLELPAAVQHFASGGPVPEPVPAGESITVNLVLEGRRFSGLYPRDEGLGLVAALEAAQANTA